MEIKKMTSREFRDEGFLQEANRKFFHPLGLALAVFTDSDVEGGEFLVEVWDYRDDPEGVFFVEGVLSPDKAANVSKLEKSKIALRSKLLPSGGNIQSLYEVADVEEC